MIESFNHRAELEIREDTRLGKMLHGVLIQEGRAATGGRSELFAPGSATWPESGIEIKIGHGGQVETLAHPVRSPEGGEIRIAVRATERIIKSVQEGLKGMSVEFFALAESRAGAVREGRSELFAPGSATWPESGIEIKIGHGGQVETLAHPVRSPEGGEIRIAVRATERIIKSVQEGLKGMSVEFFALAESRAGAVREITRALIQGAALVANPEYQQGRAEVRERRRRGLWL